MLAVSPRDFTYFSRFDLEGDGRVLKAVMESFGCLTVVWRNWKGPVKFPKRARLSDRGQLPSVLHLDRNHCSGSVVRADWRQPAFYLFTMLSVCDLEKWQIPLDLYCPFSENKTKSSGWMRPQHVWSLMRLQLGECLAVSWGALLFLPEPAGPFLVCCLFLVVMHVMGGSMK